MAIQTIAPQSVYALCRENKPVRIIDVRTPAEYAQVHIDKADLIPLDTLNPQAALGADNGHRHEPLYVICRSGARAAKACEKFYQAGLSDVLSIEGGMVAWEQAGLPVVRSAHRVISLERQVRIGAGALVLVGVILGWLIHPALYGLAGFVGAGLLFAGITDWCGMGLMLAKMPWNRAPSAVAGDAGECAGGS